ncbi:MAG: type I phosphomannose isomerase catalytic subunit [Anaerolineales bacterium]
MSTPTLYPLRLKEKFRDYGFGDRWMVEVFEKENLPQDHTLAETWEVVDRPGESNDILNGPLAGRTLHQAIETYGEALLGSDMMERFGTRFPLIIKFLDASKVLGEQIHPDDEHAKALGGFDTGKTEAWYMIKTRPKATIHVGNREGVTREQLIEALLNGNSVSCMKEYEVEPGDSFLIYAGVMHYARGGALFCEIMQNSDITYSLKHYVDEAEPGRERERAEELAEQIHLEDDFDCKTSHVAIERGPNTQTFVFACQHFAMERLDLTTGHVLALDGRRFYVLSQIEGISRVICGDSVETLRAGNSCLLPASLDRVHLEPRGDAALLKMYVPDLMANIVQPLRAQGIDDDEIVGLGGRTELNDLRDLV